MGAVCLDGSPGNFYIRQAKDPRNRHKWQIHLQGGGWCYDAPGCYNRSAQNPPGPAEFGGIVDANCTVNPTFCDFNRVLVTYCDGTSFSGDREQPVTYKTPLNKTVHIWFRGHRNLKATLETLMEDHGLCGAEELLFSGSSAGGLAALLHADFVHEYIKTRSCSQSPEKLKFRLIPGSGFMLPHHNVQDLPVWRVQMKYLYHMSNWTITNSACRQDFPSDEEWRCLFPSAAWKYIRASTFLINSALDLWQVQNIYTAEPIAGFPRESPNISIWTGYNSSATPGWHSCALDLAACTEDQVFLLNQWMNDFNRYVTWAPKYWKVGSGAFVCNCFIHAFEVTRYFATIGVNGVTVQEAVARWWHSVGQPAEAHSYWDSRRYRVPAQATSMPTCPDAFDVFRAALG